MERFEAFVGVNFWTALFVLLNTLTVFFVAKKYLFGPVMKIIHDRQQEIEDLYSQAGTARSDAQALQAEYRQKLSAARATSARLVQEAVARGESREEEILRHANREAEAILERAAADIAREKKKAINDAKDEISHMAVTIAGKVVGQALNAQDQDKLIDHFIMELGGEE